MVKRPAETVLRTGMLLAAVVAIAIPLGIIAFILVGILTHALPEGIFTLGGSYSLVPMMLSSLMLVGVTLALAVPVGIAAAIYLSEFSTQGRLYRLVQLAVDTLAGIPPILYGLYGLFIFSRAMGMRQSILAGGCTLAVMILPVVIRTVESTLKDVPVELRRGAIALGASRYNVLRHIVLPGAGPGILAAILRSIGRIVGEAAPVLLTVGVARNLPQGLLHSSRTLSVHLYYTAQEAVLHQEYGAAYVTAGILISVTITMHLAARLLRRRLHGKNQREVE
ncbi:MAG: phosphate ABC transporter permease PstA [Spirochaeta sp.]